MPDLPVIFLAVGDGSSVLEVVVWLVVGAVWLVSQVAANRKKREQAQRRNAARAEGSDPRPGSPSPAPDELAEIFKRLGADIPSTPPPRPRPAAPAPRPAPQHRRASSKIQPNIARRLARARRLALIHSGKAACAWSLPTHAWAESTQPSCAPWPIQYFTRSMSTLTFSPSAEGS